jgi:hypothetical protein
MGLSVYISMEEAKAALQERNGVPVRVGAVSKGQ